jgi:predicted nucleotide-binding protein
MNALRAVYGGKMAKAKPALFISSSTETLPVADVLQAQLRDDATINVWNQGVFGLSDYTLDRLLSATKEFDFAAFVIGADDTVKMRGKRYMVARDNVVLELGVFAGALGRKRTFMVRQKTTDQLRLPSDLEGITAAVFTWPEGVAFKDNLQKLHAELGPAAHDIRAAMTKHGPDEASMKPLSGGMIFLALWLREQGRSLHELTEPFRRFQNETERLGPGNSAYAAKAAKYACQCLEAVGIAESFGGNEFGLTPLGEAMLKSEKLRKRFANTYEVFDRLRDTD